jgi:cyclomaltodextrinase / maltogenic alpha-amylase / neopullulanase
MPVETPEWVKHAVFYQIFPDRFARSQRAQLPRGIHLKPWGSPPEEQGFQGGDLLGVVDKLDYLQDLGINAIYLNPIFMSASNHRYHTFDYYVVDPLLGGNEALRELLDAAHARQIKVVLDGVFNHASRGFWPFHHVLETGANSPYVDWFFIRDWPLSPYPSNGEITLNYDAWWGLPALPKLNVANPGMRAYLLDVAKYWIDFGMDGWRLDVPDEIDDRPFWQEFRQVVKAANPEAYIVGEIWREAPEWLEGDRFDAVMNYVFSRAAFGFFGGKTLRTEYKPGGFTLRPLTAPQFAESIEHMIDLYDWQITLAQLNLIDSHDTARALWVVNEDESALRLCVLFQMTMPGAPSIYYGSEIGLTGATDPYCRQGFPWADEEEWNHDLYAFYRKAIAMRNQHISLRTGGFQSLYAQDDVYAFLRESEEESCVIIFNSGAAAARITIPNLPARYAATAFETVWGKGEYATQSRTLPVEVPARDALVLVNRH